MSKKSNIKSGYLNKASRIQVLEYKKRMLSWPNPVEFVNNMYGSHPDDGGIDYFAKVFNNKKR